MSADTITERLKAASLTLKTESPIDFNVRVFDPDVWKGILKRKKVGRTRSLKANEEILMFPNLSLEVGEIIRGPGLVYFQDGRMSEVLIYSHEASRPKSVIKFSYMIDFKYFHPFSDDPIRITKTVARAWKREPITNKLNPSGVAAWHGVFQYLLGENMTREYTELSRSKYSLTQEDSYVEHEREYQFMNGKKILYKLDTSFDKDPKLVISANEVASEALVVPQILCDADIIFF